jgi:ABC-type multidrug transport system fused ATPase/permease subunit
MWIVKLALRRPYTFVAAAILIASLFAMHEVSFFLQRYMNRALVPILILTGILLLDVIPISFTTSCVIEKIEKKLRVSGLAGTGLLGGVFALLFCPVSAALFFGSLIPPAVQHNSAVMLPSAYGIGTGLPVFAFALLLATLALRRFVSGQAALSRLQEPALWRWLPFAGLAGLGIIAATPDLLSYMTVERFRLDANHFWVALAVLAVSVWAASLASLRQQRLVYVLVAFTSISGILMLLRVAWFDALNSFAYTGFDLGLTALAAPTALMLATRIWRFSVEPCM